MGRFHSLACVTIAILTLMLVICAKQVFADVPAVTSVVPWQLGNDTMLNVTVYHSQEVQTHHVNNVVVTFDGGSQPFSQGVHPLDDQFHFLVTLNLGEVANNPSVTVTAYCILHGGSQPYPFVIPEYPEVVLLLFLLLLATVVVSAKKVKQRFS